MELSKDKTTVKRYAYYSKRTIQFLIVLAAFFCIFQITKPLRAEIHLKKGILYVNNGYPFKALDEYLKAESLDPAKGKIYFQKGVAYGKISQKKLLSKSQDIYISKAINTFKTAQKYTSDTAVDFYLGAGYEKIGDFEHAFKTYTKLLAKDPDSKKAKEAKERLKGLYLKKGDRHLKKGDKKKAIKNYKKAIRLNKGSLKWGSIKEYKKFSKLMPNNFIVYYWLANKYYKQDDMKNAVLAFEKTRSLGVDNDDINNKLRDAYYKLGNIYKKKKLFKKAVKSYLLLKKMDPSNRYNYFRKSVFSINEIYQLTGELEKAVDILKLLEQINSLKGQGYYNIGLLYEREKKWKKAIEAFEKYLKFRPYYDLGIFYKLGILYENINNLSMALKTYEKLEQFDTKKGQGYRLMALLYEKKKMWKKAIEFFEKNLQFRSMEDISIFYKLGSLYDQTDNLSMAIDTYKKLEQINIRKGQGYFKIALMYEKRKMWDKAIKAYEKYIKFRPASDINIFKTLGELYTKVGETNKAIKSFNRLEDFKSTKGIGHKIIGNLYEKKGEWKKALEKYKNYIKNAPLDIDMHFKLAELNKKIGNKKLAANNYNKVLQLDPIDVKGHHKNVLKGKYALER